MNLKLFLVASCAMLGAWSSQAWAWGTTANTYCSGETKIPTINELSESYSHNDFNHIKQDIFQLGFTSSTCINNTNDRWRYEFNGAAVNQSGSHSSEVLLGVGRELSVVNKEDARKSYSVTITPVISAGYASFEHSNSQIVSALALTLSASGDLVPREKRNIVKDGNDIETTVPALEYIFNVRPQYANYVNVSQNHSIPLPKGESNFALETEIGLDGIVAGTRNWRWQSVLSHNHTSANVPWKDINSLVLSLRPVSEDHSSYPWNIQLWLSEGTGHYSSYIVSISQTFQ